VDTLIADVDRLPVERQALRRRDLTSLAQLEHGPAALAAGARM